MIAWLDGAIPPKKRSTCTGVCLHPAMKISHPPKHGPTHTMAFNLAQGIPNNGLTHANGLDMAYEAIVCLYHTPLHKSLGPLLDCVGVFSP